MTIDLDFDSVSAAEDFRDRLHPIWQFAPARQLLDEASATRITEVTAARVLAHSR